MIPLIRKSSALIIALVFSVSAALIVEDSKLFDVLPETLENAEGEKASATELEGKFVGLYFSVGWYPPGQAFAPNLVKFRNANTEEFEAVFVGFDKSNVEKQKYIRKNEMPWSSIPEAGRKDSKLLSQMFEVQGLPTLVVLSPDRTMVSLTGRSGVTDPPREALETWKKASQS